MLASGRRISPHHWRQPIIGAYDRALLWQPEQTMPVTKTEHEIAWTWTGNTIRVGCDRSGAGPGILLLPALSSISTRREMRPLQERLASQFTTTSVDWPGFGDWPKPPVDWRPDAYAAFLKYVVTDSSTEALRNHRCRTRRVLRDGPRRGRARLDGPLVPDRADVAGATPYHDGQAPHGVSADRPRVRSPSRRPASLYAERQPLGNTCDGARARLFGSQWLTASRLAEKLAVTRAPGARHASVRFVAGELDLVRSRAEFLALAGRIADTILVVFADGTPSRSKAEMEALAALPNVRLSRIVSGKLAVHEECMPIRLSPAETDKSMIIQRDRRPR